MENDNKERMPNDAEINSKIQEEHLTNSLIYRFFHFRYKCTLVTLLIVALKLYLDFAPSIVLATRAECVNTVSVAVVVTTSVD